MGSEVVMLARSLDEMSSAVAGMAASISEVASSLGRMRGCVEEQDRSGDVVDRRVATVEGLVTSLQIWQFGVDASLKLINEKLSGGDG